MVLLGSREDFKSSVTIREPLLSLMCSWTDPFSNRADFLSSSLADSTTDIENGLSYWAGLKTVRYLIITPKYINSNNISIISTSIQRLTNLIYYLLLLDSLAYNTTITRSLIHWTILQKMTFLLSKLNMFVAFPVINCSENRYTWIALLWNSSPMITHSTLVTPSFPSKST